ncbi:translocation/assembly module TamB domain-containing protein, partial [Flavobacteriaceae bacterium]|nr:translocation/assembly module TamB domain-containing protein [Flavobacteriaceae bacterium]
VVKSELQYALQDPTVQDRNAFFLLAQGTFVNDATGINQQAVTGNLLQSASGLLSSILEGSNDKLNFGLSYEQGMLDRVSNLQTDSRIGVSVSTQISDRVLFNGRLGVPVGGVPSCGWCYRKCSGWRRRNTNHPKRSRELIC